MPLLLLKHFPESRTTTPPRGVCTILGLCLLAIVLLPDRAAAQDGVQLGVKAGPAFMTGSGDGLIDEGLGYRTGFLAGGLLRLDLGRVALQPELLYIRKGWTVTFQDDVSTTVTLDYIELPVLAVAKLPTWGRLTPHLQAGPMLGLSVNTSAEVEGSDAPPEESVQDPGDTLQDAEVGVALGAGTDIALGTRALSLDLRYELSLASINDRSITGPDGEAGDPPFIRNQGFVLTVGFLF